MADQSERINQLKIDRNAPPPESRSRTWFITVGVIAVATIVVWLVFGRGGAAVLVETDVALKPASAAAANSVLDASGYVVARRPVPGGSGRAPARCPGATRAVIERGQSP